MLSIPTCVTAATLSQFPNASRSRVTVRNVPTSLVGCAPGAPTIELAGESLRKRHSTP